MKSLYSASKSFRAKQYKVRKHIDENKKRLEKTLVYDAYKI